MSMEQFLENLSLDTLEEIKNSAQSYVSKGGESQVDGEAEIDRLLMMHMSKHHHVDELPSIVKAETSLFRKESMKRKRTFQKEEDHNLIESNANGLVHIE